MNPNDFKYDNFNSGLSSLGQFHISSYPNFGYGESFKNEGSWRPITPRGIDSSHFAGKNTGSVDYNRFYGEHKNFKGLGPKSFKRSDENICEDVCHILFNDHNIDASEIEVIVKDRIVYLSGTVNVRSAKLEAEMILDDVYGVEDIQNNIKIKKWGIFSHNILTEE